MNPCPMRRLWNISVSAMICARETLLLPMKSSVKTEEETLVIHYYRLSSSIHCVTITHCLGLWHANEVIQTFDILVSTAVTTTSVFFATSFLNRFPTLFDYKINKRQCRDRVNPPPTEKSCQNDTRKNCPCHVRTDNTA